MVNSYIAISDIVLVIESITGETYYDNTQIPTYKERNVISSLKIINNGSAPPNEIVIVQ
ncbi:MAG: hypothetical protein ACTSRH_09835 [Promethearchaeota archaeon]